MQSDNELAKPTDLNNIVANTNGLDHYSRYKVNNKIIYLQIELLTRYNLY